MCAETLENESKEQGFFFIKRTSPTCQFVLLKKLVNTKHLKKRAIVQFLGSLYSCTVVFAPMGLRGFGFLDLDLSLILLQALGSDITIYGDGSQTRSFCFVDDLVDVCIVVVGFPLLTKVRGG